MFKCNVLISDIGKACLADFGLSRVKQDSMSRRSTANDRSGLGTLRFMAPEVMYGEMKFASDIYSFAMLMYEVCYPFQKCIHHILKT